MRQNSSSPAIEDTRRWMRGPSSAVRGSLLGLLLERPGHGGDLASRLKARLGETWRIDSNDVYRLLKQLENDGLVGSRVQPGRGRQRQPQVVYYPTDKAPAALTLWIQTLLPREPVRLGLHAKLTAAREQDIPSLVAALREHELECRRLADLVAVDDSETGTWRALCVDCVRDIVHGQLCAEVEWAARARQRIGEYALHGSVTSQGANSRRPTGDSLE
jgi:DNA-binding PadR family transcriptional regulator